MIYRRKEKRVTRTNKDFLFFLDKSGKLRKRELKKIKTVGYKLSVAPALVECVECDSFEYN